MKKFFSISLLMIIAITAGAQDWEKQPFYEKSLAGQNIRTVHVETSGGNITVKQDARERVEVFILPGNYMERASTSRQELERRLNEYYEYSLTVSDNTVHAIAKPRRGNMNWNRSVSVSFVVYVSANTSTMLTTSGGNITLAGLNGKQQFTTSGGNLNLSALKGTIRGTTSGGNIDLKDLSEDIELTTSGGNITAESSRGKLRLITSGGSLSLQRLDGEITATTSGGNVKGSTISGNLNTRTSGGNVRLEDLRCAVTAGTSGGNVDVDIKELKGEVKLTNSSGNINLTVPSGKGMELDLRASRVKSNQLNNFSGKVGEDQVVGKLNGGGIVVKASAGSGRVTLTLK